MSGGEQQMLAMGRALMADPKLLLLDEPSMGSSPLSSWTASTRRSVRSTIRARRSCWWSRTRTMLLEVSSRGYVLETGRVVLADNSAALRENPEVQNAYLGTWVMTVFAPSAPPRSGSRTPGLPRRSWPVPVRPQGLRRARRAGLRPAAQRSRRRALADRAAEGRLAVEEDRAVRPRWPAQAAAAGAGGGRGRRRVDRGPRGDRLRFPASRGPSGSRHGAGTATVTSTLPPSPARGVTLHHTMRERSASTTSQNGWPNRPVRCWPLAPGASNFDV